jgi:hypothetical protein
MFDDENPEFVGVLDLGMCCGKPKACPVASFREDGSVVLTDGDQKIELSSAQTLAFIDAAIVTHKLFPRA